MHLYLVQGAPTYPDIKMELSFTFKREWHYCSKFGKKKIIGFHHLEGEANLSDESTNEYRINK